MDERTPDQSGGILVSADPVPAADPAPRVFPVSGWQHSGADVPSDSAEEAVVWGVDPGGWQYSDTGNPIEEQP